MWDKLKRTDADSLYRSASLHAATASMLRAAGSPVRSAADKSGPDRRPADAEADLAMSWLKKTVRAGYQDAAKIGKDKDLDSLRGREDFKKLRPKPSPKPKP